MKRMIWYEWKRIWGSRLTQFAVLGCALFLAFSACSNIRLISETDADGQKVTGLEAVQLQKENRKEVTLDQETVDAVVDEYLAYTEDPATSSDDRDLAYLSEEMYVKWYLPNLPVLHLIDGAYRAYPEQRNDPMRDVFLQSRGKDFSEARKERVWENLENAVSRGEITAAEADWWDTKDDTVGEMSYVYNRAWWEIINSASLIILVMLVVCIGTAPVFAGEYQSKCDSLLLSMRYGKNRLILAKLTSSVLFTTVVYWGCMGLFAGIYLAVLGTDGWDFPVQALGENVSISYDLTSGPGVRAGPCHGVCIDSGTCRSGPAPVVPYEKPVRRGDHFRSVPMRAAFPVAEQRRLCVEASARAFAGEDRGLRVLVVHGLQYRRDDRDVARRGDDRQRSVRGAPVRAGVRLLPQAPGE